LIFQTPPFLLIDRTRCMGKNSEKTIDQCARCGTCCSKGGPALHDEDATLVEIGQIPLASLYTIRQGELARDNVSGGLICVESELIKIKSVPGSQACMYYDKAQQSCRIYENRTLECRVLECWDTAQIINMYAEHRLDRRGLLTAIPWVMSLIETHESRCSFKEIHRLVLLREKGEPEGAEGLQTMVNEDARFRYLLIEKGSIAPDMLDFLLGRPLADTLRLDFGIKVIEVGPVKKPFTVFEQQ
jgi:Fe-S-cluster containining protein